MRIWLDADNGPHVLIFKPLIAELLDRGHDVVCTARDRTNTTQLMDLYGLPYRRVGGLYRPGMLGKVQGTLGRALALVAAMRGERVDVSFGHGSRALPIAASLMRVPTVTMYDYEWVNATLFNLNCRRILLPAAITVDRCHEAGISASKVMHFPGYKEELYLGDRPLDQTVGIELGLRPAAVHVLLRPPATTAHYHNPEAEGLFAAILRRVSATPDVQLVLLPRTPDQVEAARQSGVESLIVPDRVFDGPSLVAAMDVVISGGGTMTREAAILGVPSYSFFRGRAGMVDESLVEQGRLTCLETARDVEQRLSIRPRNGAVTVPDPSRLVRFIADAIVGAAR